MKRTSLPKPVETRLLSYQRQAKQYANSSSKIPKTTKLRKSTLMALVPLAASTMLPATIDAQCSFSQTFPLASSFVSATISLPNGGSDDFKVLYSKTSGSFKRLGIQIGATNAVQTQMVMIGSNNIPFIPQLSYMATINPANFGISASVSFPIYSTSSGTIIASPASPLTYPLHIAIYSGGHYGFLTISISEAGVLSVIGGINENTSLGDSSPVLAGDCSTLPVELISFEAIPQEDVILLEWETATEINNLGFEVQRSMDGTNFQKTGWRNGHGTTAEAQTYQFKDEKVLSNELYYYRLMQIDEDGSSTYSKIITAELKGKKQDLVGNIYPNPVTEELTIPITLIAEKEVHISLFDGQGRIVKNKVVYLNQGANDLVLDMQDIVAGNYFAKIQLETETVYRKIIKL